jgi:hypothetical protein
MPGGRQRRDTAIATLEADVMAGHQGRYRDAAAVLHHRDWWLDGGRHHRRDRNNSAPRDR